jgi:hypothetical protein
MGSSTDNPYQAQASNIYNQLYQETSPIRQQLINRGTQFLQGGYDYTQSPAWQPTKLAAERNYERARGDILSNLPRGGGLQEALARNIQGRADTLTNAAGQIGMDEYNKVFGLGTGGGYQSAMGLTGLAGQQAATNAQQNAAKTQSYTDIGIGVGSILADK